MCLMESHTYISPDCNQGKSSRKHNSKFTGCRLKKLCKSFQVVSEQTLAAGCWQKRLYAHLVSHSLSGGNMNNMDRTKWTKSKNIFQQRKNLAASCRYKKKCHKSAERSEKMLWTQNQTGEKNKMKLWQKTEVKSHPPYAVIWVRWA